MLWPFANTNRGRRWAVLHARVVAKKEQTLQKRELFSDGRRWGFFTESNVTLDGLGALLWHGVTASRGLIQSVLAVTLGRQALKGY
jgi:hypothetical protein